MEREKSGVLIMDKPPDMSSARLVSRVKKLTGIKKVGHCGTLDPFATGVMVICVGKATRLARFLLQGTKTYQAVLCLGTRTDTQDITGRVIETRDTEGVTPEDIAAAFKKFEGPIQQSPPIYSALKHEGVPLYKLAREGKPVQKPARAVEIYTLKISEIRLPEVHFSVSCSSGTYIRTLCEDIGNLLGCGGCLKVLRRVESCGFSIDEALGLPDLERLLHYKKSDRDKKSDREINTDRGNPEIPLISMVDALKSMPEFLADDLLVEKIARGIRISEMRPDISFPVPVGLGENVKQNTAGEEFFKIVDRRGRLVAVASYEKMHDTYNYCCVFPS